MRLKKRAKSVSFGKKATEEAPIKAIKEEVKKTAAVEVESKKVEESKTKEEPKVFEEKKETKKEEASREEKKHEETPVAFVEKHEEESEEDLEKQLKDLRESDFKQVDEDTKESTKDVNHEDEKTVDEKIVTPNEVEHVVEKSEEKEESKLANDEQKDFPDPFVKTSSTSTGQGEPKEDKGSFFNNPNASFGKEEKKNPVLFFMIVAAVSFVLGLAVMAGLSYVFKDIKAVPVLSTLLNKPKPTVASQKEVAATNKTEVVEPTIEPSPTPAKVDLSQYTVKVLNGSGVSGEAARVKTKLTAAGFNVISTGNADASNYTKTEITIKKTVSKDALAKLQTELEKTYKVSTATATSTQTADIVVIIGSSTK